MKLKQKFQRKKGTKGSSIKTKNNLSDQLADIELKLDHIIESIKDSLHRLNLKEKSVRTRPDWAYIVNLDSEQFEVWKGNQLEPDSEDNRLVEEPNRYGQEADRMGHYPMVKNYGLNELPNPGLFLTYYSFSGDLERK
jgi:seryl-tRNA synthetase